MPKATSAAAQKGRHAARPTQPAEALATTCGHCQQWAAAKGDAYCSFCGHLLLALEVQPEILTLISTLAPDKRLIVRNASPQPLRATILPRAGPAYAALVFEPSGTLDLPPNGEVEVRVALDGARLPEGFSERALDYVCRVDDDPRKQLPLRIVVRSGPQPKLLTAALQFGEVQEGRAVERRLEMLNAGGTPLNVREIRPVGSSRLRLKQPFKPVVVQPREKLTIGVLWDGGATETEDGSAEAGVRIGFGNHPGPLLVPVNVKASRHLLEVRPSVIRLSPVLPKQDRSARVEIENRGTTDLEIERIGSDQPWLEIISRARSFTLLCPESAVQQSGQISPTTFSRTYDFKVVCHPAQLAAGKHQARVTVRPIGQEPKSLDVEVEVVHPKPYTDYIGIDFGTSNSVVAVFNQHTFDFELVEDDSRSPLIPSVLVFEDAETYKIGHAARNEIATAAGRFVRSIKRIMGYDHEMEFFGCKFSPEELAACVIRKLVEMAERKLQDDTGTYFDVRKAIITVPANFFDLQIRGVLKACEAAGLDTEEDRVRRAAQAMLKTAGEGINAGVILDEPSAAVLYYIHRLSQSRDPSEVTRAIDREGGLRLLVFDYGGGTLDVSVANVVRLDSGAAGLRILANMGDNGIGGDSIDLILMKHLLERCQEEVEGFDFDITLISQNRRDLELRQRKEAWNAEVWRQILRVRSSWKDLCEEAKIGLSERDVTEIKIVPDLAVRVVDGTLCSAKRNVKLSLHRSQLEDLLQTVLSQCQGLVESALDLAEVAREQIDYILHTGRQSLLPLIRQRVREIFPDLPPERDILDREHLKVCVARGAALYGWMRDKLVAPEARIHLLNEGRRLPHSYGVEKFASAFQPEFDEIIPRGATYPTTACKEYPSEMITSDHLNLKFYQNSGTGKTIVRNPQVNLIGEISINTLADGKPGCVVSFVIDANRKLDVFADGQEVAIQPVRLHGEESWLG